MRIVVTRERGHNRELISWLPAGSAVSEVPLTTTRYFDAHEVRSALEASANYGQFRALVVTSARSALYVALAREALARGARVLTVGTATARALEEEDVIVDLTGQGGAEDLAAQISAGPVLVLGAATMREELRDALVVRGISVEHLACYETVAAELSAADQLILREADVAFIGAPSAWRVAQAFVEPDCWVVVPGSSTATVVAREHVRVIEGWSPQIASRLGAL
ncbi:MAG TPA: uroporphyrinogen-III synthase [Acidimicrobiales bacterium]|nr:uroporphyrinogen-III synthase [Acidimicrobiales bacterium]